VGDDDLADALAAVIRGDRAGFDVLWRSLQPPLLRYLRVLAGDTAEDIASETWLQATRDIGRFVGEASGFRVWLFRVARNRAIDDNRRAWRRRETPSEPESADVSELSVPDIAFDVIERADTQWALRLIASLAPDQAEAVMLRVVVGLDVAQTAAVLGKRRGAVRIATMRGLRRLAAHPEVVGRRPPAAHRDKAAVTGAEPPKAEGV
jgi:RNA polymerase sigma-70 factor (ECF subfamily)